MEEADATVLEVMTPSTIKPRDLAAWVTQQFAADGTRNKMPRVWTALRNVTCFGKPAQVLFVMTMTDDDTENVRDYLDGKGCEYERVD